MKPNAQNNVFPEISESDATGDIAHIYSQLRAWLQVPFVNLIWRRIAAIPGALEPVWADIKNLNEADLVSGAVACLYDISAPAQTIEITPSAWTGAGGNVEERAQIRAILQDYIKANLTNLVIFSAVLSRIDGTQGDPKPATRFKAELSASTRPAIFPLIQAIPFSQLSPDLAALVERFNRIGADANTELQQATLPRKLAHWPKILLYFVTYLETYEAREEFTTRLVRLRTEARLHGNLLARDRPALNLEHGAKAQLRKVLSPFLGSTLTRMIVVSRFLENGLSAGPDRVRL